MQPTQILRCALIVVGLGTSAAVRAEIPLPPQIVFGTVGDELQPEPVVVGQIERGGQPLLEVPAEIVEFDGARYYVLRIPMETAIGAPGPTGQAGRAGDELAAILVDDELQTVPGLPVPLETADVLQIDFSGPQPPDDFVRGDCDTNGTLSVVDPLFLLFSLYVGSTRPTCRKACDSNGDGRLSAADAIHGLVYLFLEGTAPPAPFPGCGADDSELSCVRYDACPQGGGAAKGVVWLVDGPKKPDGDIDVDGIVGIVGRTRGAGVAGTPALMQVAMVRPDDETSGEPQEGELFGVFDSGLEISPAAVNFGEVHSPLVDEPLQRTITIINRSGSAYSLDVSSRSPDFAVEPETLDLPPEGAAVVSVWPVKPTPAADDAPGIAAVELHFAGDGHHEIAARIELIHEREPRSLAVALGTVSAPAGFTEALGLPLAAAVPTGTKSLTFTIDYDERRLGPATWIALAEGGPRAEVTFNPGSIAAVFGPIPPAAELGLGAIAFGDAEWDAPGTMPVTFRRVSASTPGGELAPVSVTHGEVSIRPTGPELEVDICRDHIAAATDADYLAVLHHLYSGAPPPPCLEYYDTNGDGRVSLADVTAAMNARYQP